MIKKIIGYLPPLILVGVGSTVLIKRKLDERKIRKKQKSEGEEKENIKKPSPNAPKNN